MTAEFLGNDQDAESLPQLFSRSERQYEAVEDGNGPSDQIAIQELIKKFELATKYVSVLGLFSRNENLEEVSTSDLRYLLLPGYLAKLFMKLNDDREVKLQTAEVYIKDFLRRCKDYELPGHMAIPERLLVDTEKESQSVSSMTTTSSMDHLKDATTKRAAKIAALRQKQENREKAAQLRKKIDGGTADDDDERAYYNNTFNIWILDLLEELNFVEEEKIMLEHRAKLAMGEVITEKVIVDNFGDTFKKISTPIRIVKSDIQKHVFGAGYPSLPTLTIEEFYQELVDEGKMPGPGSSKQPESLNYQGPTDAQLLEDVLKKEREEDTDDPEALKNGRDYADWKDEHRRGWGNRIGMG